MSFFGKNIKKIRGVKGLSQQEFAELFGLKRGALGAYEEGRSEPKIDTVIKVANYFSIPIDDLLTMELTVNKLLQFKGDIALKDNTIYQEKFASIPCITEKNQTDYIELFSKKTFVKDLPVLKLPINTEKIFRGYTVTNLEMTDYGKGLFPKDVVVGELVPKNVYEKLNNGTLVLLLANEQLILRRLYITKRQAILRADHRNIDDIEISLKDIRELWRIRYVFFRRLPEFNEGLEEKLSYLEQEFAKLKDKL